VSYRQTLILNSNSSRDAPMSCVSRTSGKLLSSLHYDITPTSRQQNFLPPIYQVHSPIRKRHSHGYSPTSVHWRTPQIINCSKKSPLTQKTLTMLKTMMRIQKTLQLIISTQSFLRRLLRRPRSWMWFGLLAKWFGPSRYARDPCILSSVANNTLTA